jgi:hypothetical protein
MSGDAALQAVIVASIVGPLAILGVVLRWFWVHRNDT